MFKRNILRKSSAIFCALLVASGIGFTSTSSEIGTWGITASAVSSFGGFEYEVNEGTVTITGYDGTDTNITVPSEIAGKSVTAIGTQAFASCFFIEGVELPDTIVSIGKSAFMDCTALKAIAVPDGVTLIDEQAFAGCTALESATIGKSVKEIGNSAFARCGKLQAITIPDSVLSIGNQAFVNTGITGVTIGNSCKVIGDGAFQDCTKLTTVSIGNSVVTIGDYAFNRCSAISNLTIGNSVETIGDYVFNWCSSLTSVVIPDSTEVVGKGAFNQCSKLSTCTMGENVTDIGAYAFYQCSNLSACTIGVNVKDIGASAFYQCSALKKITLPKGLTEVKDYVFANSGLENVVIPNGVQKIGSSAFSSSALQNVKFGKSVKEIGGSAFSNTKLKNVVLPDSLEVIGNSAFSQCESLSNVAFGNSVKTIGAGAFYYCPLTSVVIPASTEIIGARAFRSSASTLSEVYVYSNKLEFPVYNSYYDHYANGMDKWGMAIYAGNCYGRVYYSYDSFPFNSTAVIYGLKDSSMQQVVTDYNSHNSAKIKFIPLSENAAEGITNISSIKSENIKLGEYIEVNAKAVGLGDGYTYAVYYKKKSDSKWTVAQTFNENDKIYMKPLYATEYDVCVKAKDSEGRLAKKYFTVNVEYNFQNISELSTDTIKKGNSVTAHGITIGGQGTKKYAIYYKQSTSSKWATAQDFTTTDKVDITLKNTGTYNICIKAKDSKGTVVKKYFDVKVMK